jgi:hypothetical protein
VQSQAATLFYNGPPNGAGGWQVTGLFGNYFVTTTTPVYPPTAAWEIRQGIGQGNPGTLVGSGPGSLTLLPISLPPNGKSTWSYFQASVALSPLTLNAGTCHANYDL